MTPQRKISYKRPPRQFHYLEDLDVKIPITKLHDGKWILTEYLGNPKVSATTNLHLLTHDLVHHLGKGLDTLEGELMASGRFSRIAGLKNGINYQVRWFKNSKIRDQLKIPNFDCQLGVYKELEAHVDSLELPPALAVAVKVYMYQGIAETPKNPRLMQDRVFKTLEKLSRDPNIPANATVMIEFTETKARYRKTSHKLIDLMSERPWLYSKYNRGS